MKIIAWNCQGLAKPKAVRALRQLLKDSKPDLVFLSEIKTPRSSNILKALAAFSLSNFSLVPPIGFAGGLILAWSSNINLQITAQGSSFINATIISDPNFPPWHFTGIYCPCSPTGTTIFWSSITDLSSSIPGPWLIIGDFNSITSNSEKRGGAPFASSSKQNLSSEFNNLGLIDLGFHGSPFTWNNKREGLANIQQRIDRGVGNSQWLTLFPHASILHLPAISSDHNPLLLNTSIDSNPPKPFRFESMWLDDKSCFDTVHTGWNQQVTGSPSFKLHSRIQNVKNALKLWNTNHFGNCHKKIKELKIHIESVQNLDKSANNIAIDAALQVELDVWLARVETFWWQRSKDKWLKDGDANTKATTEDALCISNVLEKFSIWSSQCANKDKSLVHFSKNTPSQSKIDILNTLGFKECNHKAKHLGLPFCHPKSRKDSFTDVCDKISSNLSGWKSKNLSQASRTILLKAVAQAIPSYTMSVSLIPKGICNMMDAKLRKFWWGENCNGNSLMLKTWDSICSPKSSGGLGFRRMFDLNKALFSKITWNVAANSDKLWVSLLKSKYLRGKFFLHDNLSFNACSWLWTDIKNSRDLILKGACFHINSDSDVLIWQDPWITSLPGFKPSQNPQNPNPVSPLLVKELIIEESLSWNFDLLNLTFPPLVVKEIKKIHISHLALPKTLFWSPSKSGNFSSKSAYLVDQSRRFLNLNSYQSFNWKNLWNSKLHNRHKLLFWRIINDILPTKSKLNCLFQSSNLDCLFCDNCVESADHLFVNCPFIHQAWFCSKWNFRMDHFYNTPVKEWLSLIFDKKNNNFFPSSSIKDEFIIFTAVLFDFVWLNRNKKAHNSPYLNPQVLSRKANQSANSHWKSQITSHTSAKSSPNLLWIPPPFDWLKINTDFSFDDGTAHSSCIIRNSNGSILLAHSTAHVCLDALAAEALAILEACKILSSARIKNAIFEADSLDAISFIVSDSCPVHWTAKVVIEEIKKFSGLWPKWRFKYVGRNSNFVAHSLAKWACCSDWDGIVPPDLIPLVCFGDGGHPLVDSFISCP